MTLLRAVDTRPSLPLPRNPLHTYPGLPSGVLGCPRLVLGYGMGVGFGFGVGDGGLGVS